MYLLFGPFSGIDPCSRGPLLRGVTVLFKKKKTLIFVGGSELMNKPIVDIMCSNCHSYKVRDN